MAEAQVRERKQLMKCPICSKALKSHKTLPCMHTFCEKCICKYVSDLIKSPTEPDTIKCPVCKTHFLNPTINETPQEWAAKLPNFFSPRSGSAPNQEDQDVRMYCEPCIAVEIQHVSVAFCVTCSEYLCEICYNCHKRYKAIRGHQITVHPLVENQASTSTQADTNQSQKKKKK